MSNIRKPTKLESQYIAWQNKSFQFYLASRTLYFDKLYSPTVFCANQTIELLLKATLIYWDKSFKPEEAKHKFPSMLDALHNKVKGSNDVYIPEYFYHEGRYQSVSRYPRTQLDNVIIIPGNFLFDLDKVFYDLIVLVPIQFNSMLINLLGNPEDENLYLLKRDNFQIDRLIEFLQPWLKKSPNDLAPFPKEFITAQR